MPLQRPLLPAIGTNESESLTVYTKNEEMKEPLKASLY